MAQKMYQDQHTGAGGARQAGQYGAQRPRRSAKRRAALRRKRLLQLWMRRLVFLLAVVLLAVAIVLVLRNAGFGGGTTNTGDEDAGSQNSQMAALPEPTPDTRIVVAVDPGHGGVNPNAGAEDIGSEGAGITEVEMTKNIAAALVQLLEQDGRFNPVLTTDQTAYMYPSERGAVAKAAGAQLLISIHGNSASYDTSIYGFECYPATPGMAYHEQSMKLASLIAQGFAAEGAKLRGIDGIRYIYFEEDDSRTVIESNDNTVYDKSTFTVLETGDCPSVLVEQCFVTNASDVDKFGDADGSQLSARIYYNAICSYFDLEPLS